jgi:hypothetical protein
MDDVDKSRSTPNHCISKQLPRESLGLQYTWPGYAMDSYDPGLRSENLLPVWQFLHRAMGVDDELLLTGRMSVPVSLLWRPAATINLELGSWGDHCFLLPNQKGHVELSTLKSLCARSQDCADYNCPNTVGPGGFFQYCQSLLSTQTTVIVVDNIFDQKTLSTSSWTLPSGSGASYQVVYPIQVRTGVNDAISTATTTPTTSSTKSGSRLNTASIVGVAVSVTCSVLGLIFGVGFKIWKHRKQQEQQKQTDGATSAGDLEPTSEGGNQQTISSQ